MLLIIKTGVLILDKNHKIISTKLANTFNFISVLNLILMIIVFPIVIDLVLDKTYLKILVELKSLNLFTLSITYFIYIMSITCWLACTYKTFDDTYLPSLAFIKFSIYTFALIILLIFISLFFLVTI